MKSASVCAREIQIDRERLTVADRERHGPQFVGGIGEVFGEGLIDRKAVTRHQQGIAVGRRGRDHLGGDVGRGAGPILDHDLIAELRAEFLRDAARKHVDAATGRETDDECNFPAGIQRRGLRRRNARAGEPGDQADADDDKPGARDTLHRALPQTLFCESYASRSALVQRDRLSSHPIAADRQLGIAGSAIFAEIPGHGVLPFRSDDGALARFGDKMSAITAAPAPATTETAMPMSAPRTTFAVTATSRR